MNNSESQISPAWPTRWPKDSFKLSTLWLILASIGAAVVLGGIAMVVFVVWLYSSHVHFSPTNLSDIFVPGAIVQLTAELGIIAVIYIMLPRVSKFSLRELGFVALKPRDIWIILAGVVGMVILADGGSALIQSLAHVKHDQDAIKVLKALHGVPKLTFFAVFAIVLQPFIEESVFRVFIFNWAMRYRGFWFGAIVSGVLFGLAHADLYAAAPLALGGIVLATVYYRTRNAYASMVTHALFNSIATLLLIFAPKLAT